ncbi:MAG: hypothetical protein RIS35_369 [Pseudomonadota bacterium]|jgi:nucleotide-binding universal stress UspA family protein
MYKRILLAYDGSAAGQKALLDCSAIAQWSKAELFLVAVMPGPVTPIATEGWVYTPETDPAQRDEYQAILDSGLQRLREAGLNAKGEVVSGSPVDEIVRHAEKIGADLIIVGHRHLDSWAERWWRGSMSKVLIEQSPCSVLVAITRA